MTARLTHQGERLLRFALAGMVNTAFGLAFYPLLLWSVAPLRAHYMVALGISQVVCVCFAYVTYKLSVFRTRGNMAREFSAFSTFYLIILSVNWLILPVLVEFGGIPPMIAQLGFNVIVIISSFFWHSLVTFAVSGKQK